MAAFLNQPFGSIVRERLESTDLSIVASQYTMVHIWLAGILLAVYEDTALDW